MEMYVCGFTQVHSAFPSWYCAATLDGGSKWLTPLPKRLQVLLWTLLPAASACVVLWCWESPTITSSQLEVPLVASTLLKFIIAWSWRHRPSLAYFTVISMSVFCNGYRSVSASVISELAVLHPWERSRSCMQTASSQHLNSCSAQISPWFFSFTFADVTVAVCCGAPVLWTGAPAEPGVGRPWGLPWAWAAPLVTWHGLAPGWGHLLLLAVVWEGRNQPCTLGGKLAVGVCMGRHKARGWGGKHSLCGCTWLKDEGFCLVEQPWESHMERGGGLVQEQQYRASGDTGTVASPGHPAQ